MLCVLFENTGSISRDHVVHTFDIKLDLGEMEITNGYPKNREEVSQPVVVLIMCTSVHTCQVFFIEIVQREIVRLHIMRDRIPIEVLQFNRLEPR